MPNFSKRALTAKSVLCCRALACATLSLSLVAGSTMPVQALAAQPASSPQKPTTSTSSAATAPQAGAATGTPNTAGPANAPANPNPPTSTSAGPNPTGQAPTGQAPIKQAPAKTGASATGQATTPVTGRPNTSNQARAPHRPPARPSGAQGAHQAPTNVAAPPPQPAPQTQPASQYPAQHSSQYPSQHSSQQAAQYPSQHPSQYPPPSQKEPRRGIGLIVGGAVLGGFFGAPLISLGIIGSKFLNAADDVVQTEAKSAGIQAPDLGKYKGVVVGAALVPGIVFLVAGGTMITFGAVRMVKHQKWKKAQESRAAARKKPVFSPYLSTTARRTGVLGLSGRF